LGSISDSEESVTGDFVFDYPVVSEVLSIAFYSPFSLSGVLPFSSNTLSGVITKDFSFAVFFVGFGISTMMGTGVGRI